MEIGLTKVASEVKVHMDSIIKLQNLKKGGIVRILTETQEDRKLRVEVTECRNTNLDMVKVLIDNVLLANTCNKN
jgi:hypothetical protein